MIKLEKVILRYFLLFALLIAISESILDSLFNDMILVSQNRTVYEFIFKLMVYLILSVSLFVIFAHGFKRVIGKKIKQEQDRQLNLKNMLYSHITHDLKTPITMIQGFSKALIDNKVSENEKKDTVEAIYRHSKGLAELIDLLFQYSKLETSEQQMPLDSLDLARVIRDITALYYEKFEEKGMDVWIDLPETPVICQLNYIEITRGLTNIYLNTIKHNPDHTKIKISLEIRDEKAIFKLSDSGPEINDEIKESIFEPFISTETSRRTNEGNGLGLAISKAIIIKHGGLIYLEEADDNYVKTFVIELPIGEKIEAVLLQS